MPSPMLPQCVHKVRGSLKGHLHTLGYIVNIKDNTSHQVVLCLRVIHYNCGTSIYSLAFPLKLLLIWSRLLQMSKRSENLCS